MPTYEITIKKEQVIEAVQRYLEDVFLRGSVSIMTLTPTDQTNYDYKAYKLIVNQNFEYEGFGDKANEVVESSIITAQKEDVKKRKVVLE